MNCKQVLSSSPQFFRKQGDALALDLHAQLQSFKAIQAVHARLAHLPVPSRLSITIRVPPSRSALSIADRPSLMSVRQVDASGNKRVPLQVNAQRAVRLQYPHVACCPIRCSGNAGRAVPLQTYHHWII